MLKAMNRFLETMVTITVLFATVWILTKLCASIPPAYTDEASEAAVNAFTSQFCDALFSLGKSLASAAYNGILTILR